ESATVADDGNEVRFFLREGPKFHDGTDLTADDVVFSIEILKTEGHPQLTLPMKEVVSVEAAGPGEVVVRFSGKQSREMPSLIAGLPIFSRADYADKDFAASTLAPPLGSGPYKVSELKAGSFIEYDRVADYWARDLPIMRGQNNFDTIRVEFYRDRTTGFEAFKKGAINYREEFTSKVWATEYEFPAVAEGKVEQIYFDSEKRPGWQGWHPNMRRLKFQDARTRRAIGLVFDFEWVNQNLFYGSYARSASFFEKSIYKAEGAPGPAELALLEPLRGQIPDEAFGAPYVYPPSDGSGRDRKRLREAVALLDAAGWQRQDGKLVNDFGEPFTAEFLIRSPVFERVLGKYIGSLKSIGIDASIRLVDPAQYQERLNTFDFDLAGLALSSSAVPFEGLRSSFSSESADKTGSRNYSGITDPAVDALIDAVLAADNRGDHKTALSALDRVLRANSYFIPQWFASNHRIAIWKEFGWPEKKPDYAFPVESLWWYDPKKAAQIGRGG
ncbi:MAG: extracellular solute-binding protein, partial [Alphaproteobacteria bacterium]